MFRRWQQHRGGTKDQREERRLLWLKWNLGVGKSVLLKKAYHGTKHREDKAGNPTLAFFFNAKGC
ncbi:hypothetical protein Micbo1qcDRAFT_160289, partial [Microdochium bolleyi]